MGEKYQALVERLAEIRNLDRVLAVLNWDRQVKMPPAGRRRARRRSAR